MSEIADRYDPTRVEPHWYAVWEERGYFHAEADSPKQALLHRHPAAERHRLPPHRARPQQHAPGHPDPLQADGRVQHALACRAPTTRASPPSTWSSGSSPKEGKTKEDLGREAFVARVWQWKEESGGTIIRQLKRLGASCDWERERFTMDEGLSAAVREVFVRLWEEGLIYRGDYIVNWCPRCQTVLSDLEVEREERDAEFVYIKYGPLTLGTVRPETKLGDTAVAVHPKDKRYRQLRGQDARGALGGGEHHDAGRGRRRRWIPKFGTGVIKVTPGHDPTDFEIGKPAQPARPHRHRLRRQDDASGRQVRGPRPLRDAGSASWRTCRPSGSSTGSSPTGTRSGVCYRCKTVVEPLVSKQWYVRTKPLAEPAIKAVRSGKIKIVPRALEQDVLPLDGEHPRLGDLAPALVGPPHPGVVLRPGREHARVAHRSDRVPAVRRGAAAGHRRARHLVLLRPLAVLHPRVARGDAGARRSSIRPRSCHRLRHPVLLGGADGDARHQVHGRRPVPPRLHPRPHPRRRGPEDVQVEGQRRSTP